MERKKKMPSKRQALMFIATITFFFTLFSCTPSTFQTFKNEKEKKTLLAVTSHVKEYAIQTVQPIVDTCPKRDLLSLLLEVSRILTDNETGIHANALKPGTYIMYNMFDKFKLGFLATLRLSAEQKKNLKVWHLNYMQNNPADVYFAPSADEIIKYKAAFGCTHYARSFIAVVKALGLIEKPENLRYVITCVADSYNEALGKQDSRITINGHQFVMVKINAKWFAINTSKSQYVAMPENFSPDLVQPPFNIPIRLASYPDITFLFRKIGKDFNDDCGDDSYFSLMNIYRSGHRNETGFEWKKFGD